MLCRLGNISSNQSAEEIAAIEKEDAEINKLMDQVNREEEITDINEILERN